MRRSLNVGLAMGLLSGATFGTSGSFAASLIAAGWTPATAVTARVVLSAFVLTVPALLAVRTRHVTWASTRTIGLYGVIAIAGAQLCYFNALSHLSVGVALLIEYSGILLVVGWGWLRHGRRPARLTVVGGAAALGGLVLVLDLAGSSRVDAIGLLWGLGAAVGLAAYFILSAERDDSVPPLVMAWGGLVVGGIVLGAASLSGLLPLHATFTSATLLGRQVPWFLPVLGLALIAAVIAYVAGIGAVRLLGSNLASFLGLTEVLFAVVFAWLLLGQRLDATQLAGGALVVAGIALVRLDELGRSRSRSAATRSGEDFPEATQACRYRPGLRQQSFGCRQAGHVLQTSSKRGVHSRRPVTRRSIRRERGYGMEKVAAVFPVIPGKDARDVSAIFDGRAEEYAESRRRQGIRLERVYQQETPMGRFVIVYAESDRPFVESLGRIAESDLAIDREFVQAVKEVHGVDPDQPPPGEPPEVLADWSDPNVTERKRGLAFSVPVMPGATDRGRAFAKEAYEARRDELTAARRARRVSRELVCLNHTPMGDVVCVYLEADDPAAANRGFAESRDDYDAWFKQQLKTIFPPEIDFDQPIPGVTEILDSEQVLVAS